MADQQNLINLFNNHPVCFNFQAVCFTFGIDVNEFILRYFEFFCTFRYALPDIRLIGVPSANGFINLISYRRNNYESFAILKSAQLEYSDNLYYEYVVGKYFINNQAKIYPCFVKTYGLFRFRQDQDWYNMSTQRHKRMNLALALEPLHVNNISSSCVNSARLSILIEEIKDAFSIRNILELSGDIMNRLRYQHNKERFRREFLNTQLLYILVQVYFPLYFLRNSFTHYDLHTDNVLIFNPLPDNHYITFNYYYNERQFITFKSKYIAKIIDYGRAFYDNEYPATINAEVRQQHDRNGPTGGHLFNSNSVYNIICQVPECVQCGEGQGFYYLGTNSNENTHWIATKINNQSHDLRYINLIAEYIYANIHQNDIPLFMQQQGQGQEPFRHITYMTQYGTAEDHADGMNVNILNITDMYRVLRNLVNDRNIRQINDNYYNPHNGQINMGTLNVYSNQHMRFIPA